MSHFRILLALSGCLTYIVSAAAASTPPWQAGIRSDPKAKEGMVLHQCYVNEAKHRQAKILFLGDSIIAYWPIAGISSWKKYFEPMDSEDIGIGGEITQSTLWRLDHGAVDGINPATIVLMIGSNNLIVDNPADTALGIKAVVDALQKKLPHTKIVLLGILPRDPGPIKIPLRQKVEQTNSLVAKLLGKRVTYIDLGRLMLEKDGSISRECLPDGVHPSAKGYDLLSPLLVDAIQHAR